MITFFISALIAYMTTVAAQDVQTTSAISFVPRQILITFFISAFIACMTTVAAQEGCFRSNLFAHLRNLQPISVHVALPRPTDDTHRLHESAHSLDRRDI